MAKPGLTTIKTLFAHSCNRCAFPGCDQRLTDPRWSGVHADIAHIRGEKPGAARYAPDMTDKERNAVDNLMLLCPNHHREIDRLRPQDWSAERLMKLKLEHEQKCAGHEWASDSLLEYFSSLLASQEAEGDTTPDPAARPRLVVEEDAKNSLHVVNISESDAFAVAIALSPDSDPNAPVRLDGATVPRLSPGGRWQAGIVIRTFGNAGRASVRVSWTDADGRSYDADFIV